MRVARRYLITGRVQGVGFRVFTEAAACREGIHGWVRNLTDGPGEGVEAVAEGEADAIERFERSIRQGPRGARVDRVEIEITVPNGHAVGFAIK
ncbi:MAG: acylphosphatase [Acidobacteria bacterium]|nr:acylphosphatase [Acidobacteriota bacterium]